MNERTGPAGTGHDTLMWEVAAAPGRHTELMRWIDEEAAPALRAAPHCLRADVYTAADERAVIIARFDGRPVRLPDPPTGLLRRPAHQWPFRHRGTLAGDPG